jgi:hypothetical protein
MGPYAHPAATMLSGSASTVHGTPPFHHFFGSDATVHACHLVPMSIIKPRQHVVDIPISDFV